MADMTPARADVPAWARRRLRRAAAGLRREVHLAGLAVWRGTVRFYSSEDPTFASSIAYFSLLSLFPFFLFAFTLLGSVAAAEADRERVVAFVLQYFPHQFDFLVEQLDAIRAARWQFGLLGTVILIWAAMGVFGAITTAVNYAWGVERQRDYLTHKLISFVMLVTAGVLLVVALLLISAMNLARTWWFAAVLEWVPWLVVLQSLAVEYATTLLLILVVGLVFYFAPNANVRFRDVWLGAIITGLLWRGALAGFSWYVRDLTRLNIIHGSIAGVVVFLFWVYVSAVILLYGAEIAAAHARLRRHRPDELPAAPTPRM